MTAALAQTKYVIPFFHAKFNGSPNDSVKGIVGTVTGTPTYVTGKVGQAGSFANTGKFLIVEYPSQDFSFLADNFTACYWIRRTGVKTWAEVVLVVGDYRIVKDLVFTFGIFASNGKIRMHNGGQDFYSLSGITSNVWYHVAMVKRSNKIYFYLNGADVTDTSTNTITYIPNHGTKSFRIGNEIGNAYVFPGDIEDVRIYSQALSQNQIKDIYNSGNGLETDITDNSILSSNITASTIRSTILSSSQLNSTIEATL